MSPELHGHISSTLPSQSSSVAGTCVQRSPAAEGPTCPAHKPTSMPSRQMRLPVLQIPLHSQTPSSCRSQPAEPVKQIVSASSSTLLSQSSSLPLHCSGVGSLISLQTIDPASHT